MDAARKASFSFYFDEVSFITFSFNDKVERECERQEVQSSGEQSVSLDEALRKFLEEHKNCTTSKETLSNLRTWYRWCKGTNEKSIYSTQTGQTPRSFLL